jgi:diguanylate cyclase (GGDEF)-like protein
VWAETVGGAGQARTSSSRREWILAVICAVAAILTPGLGTATIADVLFSVAAFAGVLMSWLFALRERARPFDIWRLFALGLTCWFLADLTRQLDPDMQLGSLADVPMLAGYGFVLFAMSKLVGRSLPLQAAGIVLDSIVGGTILALLASLAVIEPVAPVFSNTQTIALQAYVMCVFVSLAGVGWLVRLPARRDVSFWLLLALLGLRLIVAGLDVCGWVAERPGALEAARAVSIATFMILPLALRHSSARELAKPRSDGARGADHRRLVLLGTSLIVAPVLAITAQALRPDRFAWGYGFGAVLVSMLALRRLLILGRERVSAFEALTHRSTHDPLTGLPNRPLLIDRIEQAIRRTQRNGTQVAVLHIDLDRFKAVNDTWGHQAGDELLRQVAARLLEVVRPGDTVARLTGDEFAIVCDELDSSSTVFTIADRVVNSLDEPFTIDANTVLVSASIGIALLVERNDTAEDLMEHADAAMLRAKRAGRDRWEIFDAELQSWVHERRGIESALDRALHNNEMRLVYQPIVDIASGRTVGFEALLRWARPGHGLVPPDRFVGLAEEMGLIVPIGEWVLHEACRELASWKRDGAAPGVHMAINVSVRQLRQPHLAEIVAREIRNADIDPSMLVLEITESMLVEDTERTILQLEALRRVGVQIAIDDFGTGYSSLSYLRALPVDVVKIDRSFIQRMASSEADTAVVAAIMQLSHALGFRVVAEGVETDVNLQRLRQLGCDFAQGYLWSEPLSSAQARRVIVPVNEQAMPPARLAHDAPIEVLASLQATPEHEVPGGVDPTRRLHSRSPRTGFLSP